MVYVSDLTQVKTHFNTAVHRSQLATDCVTWLRIHPRCILFGAIFLVLLNIPDVTFSYFVINLPDFKTLIYYTVHQTTVSIDTRQTNTVQK